LPGLSEAGQLHNVRRRRDDTADPANQYKEDDIELIENPEDDAITVRVKKPDGTYVDANELAIIMEEVKGPLAANLLQIGIEIKRVTPGTLEHLKLEEAEEQRVKVAESKEEELMTTINTHLPLIITLGVLLFACLILSVVCLICVRHRRRNHQRPMTLEHGVRSQKEPIVLWTPAPDAQLAKSQQAPIVYSEPTAVGQPPREDLEDPALAAKDTDDDNTWVVPMDQISAAEQRKQEEMEHTRF